MQKCPSGHLKGDHRNRPFGIGSAARHCCSAPAGLLNACGVYGRGQSVLSYRRHLHKAEEAYKLDEISEKANQGELVATWQAYGEQFSIFVSAQQPAPITEDLANKLVDYAIACDWGQSGQ